MKQELALWDDDEGTLTFDDFRRCLEVIPGLKITCFGSG